MVSASVWRLLTVVVFWLLVVLRAARSSLYLMKYTVRSNPSTLFLQNNSYKSSSQELLFFVLCLVLLYASPKHAF